MFSLLERWALRKIAAHLRKHSGDGLDVLRILWPDALYRPNYTIGDMDNHARQVSLRVREDFQKNGHKTCEQFIQLAWTAGTLHGRGQDDD